MSTTPTSTTAATPSLTFPTRVIEPGGVEVTPFGDENAPSSETDPNIVASIPPATLSAIQGIIQSGCAAAIAAAGLGSIPAPATAPELTSDYIAANATQATIEAALATRIKNGGN